MNISFDPFGTFKAAETSSAISMAVVKKTQDVAKAQGDAAVALLQSAAKVAKSSHAAQPGNLDVTA